MTFRVEGTDELQKVANALKEAGDRDLTKAVSGALRDVAKPLGERVLRRGAERMPHRGGFSDRVSGQGVVGVSSSPRGRVASAQVLLRNKGVDLKSLDAGVLRHPVFARTGRSRVWVRQTVPAGVFTAAFQQEARVVQDAATKAAQGVLDDVARKA